MEYIKDGILMQEKELFDRCAKCNSKLWLGVYRTPQKGKKLVHIVRCKKCNTASVIKK